MTSVGDRLGPYALVAELGAGAMGRVFQGRRPSQARDVAVKILHERVAHDPDHARRFLRESRALREVDHPSVVDIIEVDVDDHGRPYIVMPLVDGTSLDRVLANDGPLALDVARRIVASVAAGLDAVHAMGMVHRDVKPSNIIASFEGGATLMDLGLAKRVDASLLTAPDQVMGTIPYTAPELVLGEDATPSSDVYALACTAYEALTGQPPFTGAPVDIADAHLRVDPPQAHGLRPDLPPSISEVFGYALAKRPERRPPTATALASMLHVASKSVAAAR